MGSTTTLKTNHNDGYVSSTYNAPLTALRVRVSGGLHLHHSTTSSYEGCG